MMQNSNPNSQARATPSLGIYRHYKGNNYRVLGVALNTETHEEMVVYQALYGNHALWARPLVMFSEDVEHEGVVQQRFRKIQQEDQ